MGSVAYNPPIGRKNATYIPLIYCLLGGYMLPTTFYGNQKQPLKQRPNKQKDKFPIRNCSLMLFGWHLEGTYTNRCCIELCVATSKLQPRNIPQYTLQIVDRLIPIKQRVPFDIGIKQDGPGVARLIAKRNSWPYEMFWWHPFWISIEQQFQQCAPCNFAQPLRIFVCTRRILPPKTCC